MLAGLIAKYSYFGLDDTWASYEQMEAEKKWRWLTWTIGGLVFALGLMLWQASSLRQRMVPSPLDFSSPSNVVVLRISEVPFGVQWLFVLHHA